MKSLLLCVLTYSFFCVTFLSASLSAASNSGVTYQGRILKPDGSPLSGATTQFKLQIRTPDAGSCLMYEEIQSLDMRNTNGAFSLTMNDGTGSRTDSTGLGIDRVFANRGTFTFGAATCASGTTYTPNESDGRVLVVLFKDETMGAWEPIPAQKINFVPFAFESKQIAGFTADSLLRVVNGSGDPITGLAPLSNAQYTELVALVNGTSTAFTKSGQLGGSALPTMNSGEALGWNGTAWVSTPTGTPGANSITTTMLQGGSVTGAKLDPAISISTSGTVASAITTTRDFKVYATSPSTFYVEMLAPALTASYTLTWPLNAGTVGQVLTTNGSGVLSWTTPSSSGITALTGDVTATGPGSVAATVASVGTSTAANVHSAELLANAATAVNTNNAIVKRDGSGNFAASAVTTTSVQADTLKLNNAGSILNIVNPSGAVWTMTLPATAGSSGQVLSTNGSGVTSWIAAPTSSQWTTQAPGINYMGGNIGIGTTSPVAKLDVAGTANLNNILQVGTFGATVNYNGRNVFDVSGNANLSGAYVSRVSDTTPSPLPDRFIFEADSNSVRRFSVAQTGDMYVSGNVGIGTTSPVAKLDVVSSATGTVQTLSLRANPGSSGATKYNSITFDNTFGPTNKKNQFILASQGSPRWALGNDMNGDGTENFFIWGASTGSPAAVLINSAGNVGIGTTSPTQLLQLYNVAGSPQSSGTSQPGASLRLTNATGNVVLDFGINQSGSAYTWLQSTQGNNLGINQPFVINANGGNVGIGTTAPAYKLDVAGDVNVTGNFKVNGVNIAAGGGSVTSVTSANTDIAVATTTTTPVLTLNSGNGANQIVKLTAASKYPAVDGSLITNLDATNIAAGTLPVARGGTGNTTLGTYSVLASNAAGNVAAVPGSLSGSILQYSVTGPVWSSMSLPTSATANQLLYSSSTNVVSGLASANNGVLATNGSGVPSISSTLPTAVQGNITSTGTITSGVWNGTAIDAAHGGTGQTAFTIGDLLYASSTSALSKLPASNSGYVLTSNGVGAAPSWQAAASGSQWTTQAPGINYMGGNVGIGTTAPAAKLHVVSPAAGGWSFKAQGDYAATMDATGTYGVTIYPNAGGVNRIYSDYYSGSTALPLQLGTFTTPQTMTLLPGGNVGIGTTAPTGLLALSNSTGSYQLQLSNPVAAQTWEMNTENSGTFSLIDRTEVTRRLTVGHGGDTTFIKSDGTTAQLTIQNSSGNVGIGTTSPTQKLEVSGTVKATDFAVGAASLKLHPCEIHINGSGAGGAVQAADGDFVNCVNAYGAAMTVTSFTCFSDNAGTTTVQLATNGAVNLLSSAVTCSPTGATGTLNGTPSVSNNGWLTTPTITPDGTTKSIVIVVGRSL